MRKKNLLGLGLAFASFLSTWAIGTTALTRDAADQEIVDRERARSPEAVALLEKGEALAVSGSLEQSVDLFRKGSKIDPYLQGMFDRRECEALTALDRRAEAQTACLHAVQSFRTPATIGATTRSLVSGRSEPTFLEVVEALSLVAHERERAPGQPQLAAAMCDIAESMGDAMMLQRCAEELQRIAPNYPPTQRAQRLLSRRCPPWLFWGGWLIIAAGSALTVADALRRYGRRKTIGAPAAAMLSIVVLGFLSLSPSRNANAAPSQAGGPPAPDAPPALAGVPPRAVDRPDTRNGPPPAAAKAPDQSSGPGKWFSQWPIDDQDPVKSVPPESQLKRDPLQAGYFLQDLIGKAEIASKAGEHGAAIKFYEAVLKMVPNRAVGLARMCDEFEAMGNLQQATNACGLALGLDGVTVGDYAHFVHLVLRKEGRLTDKEVAALTNVIDHMKKDDAGRALGEELQCEVATRTSNIPKLQECAAALAETAPNGPKTIVFQWELAVRQHDYRAARDLLVRAKTAGVGADQIDHMEHATSQAQGRRRGFISLAAGGALVLMGCAFYALFMFRRRSASSPPVAPAAASA